MAYYIYRQQGSKETLSTCRKCRSAPAGWKPHFLSASGTTLAPITGCAGSICAAAQKMAKMSTKKWAVSSLPPKILGTADRTLVIRWTRERSVRTSLRQMNPPQEAGDKYSRTVNGRLPVGRSQCPASWQIVRAEQKFLQENNSNFSRSGQCPLNA